MTIEHKGHKAVQSDYNHHVTVYDATGKRVFHAQVQEPKSAEELKEYIDFYLQLQDKLDGSSAVV